MNSSPVRSNDFLSIVLPADHSLARAKRLLTLAEFQGVTSRDDMQTLAGLTITLAVAHLAGSIEALLLHALANGEAQAGKRPTLNYVGEMVPPSLPGKLRLLVKISSETRPIETPPFFLDEDSRETKDLFRIMNLRNRLMHHEEGIAMGTLADLGAQLAFVDRRWVLDISPPMPVDPWTTITMDDAHFIVQAAERFFDELQTVGAGSDRPLVFLRRVR